MNPVAHPGGFGCWDGLRCCCFQIVKGGSQAVRVKPPVPLLWKAESQAGNPGGPKRWPKQVAFVLGKETINL